MTGLQHHRGEAGALHREARDIIAELMRASVGVRARRTRPRWYHRLLGMEMPPAEAVLVMTAAGQIGAYMNEDGSCILRCRGDANANRHLRSVLPEGRRWDRDERAWTVPADGIEDAFVALLSVMEREHHDGEGLERAVASDSDDDLPPPTAVVMNSRYGMMSGQQRGDVVEMMVLEPRMQHVLRADTAFGAYRQDSLIGLWTLSTGDFADAMRWASGVDDKTPIQSTS